MSNQSVFERMEHWGYYLVPGPSPHIPGYAELLVAIRDKPTGEHFDPETVHLRIRDRHDIAAWTTLGLKPLSQKPRRVCAGQVILRDQQNEHVDFFVFGGALEVATRPGETVYAVRSPAPILELTEQLESIPDQLASEVEALIGELEARWMPDERGFACRLAQVDPLVFYVASLHSILLRYEQAPHLRRAFPKFYAALTRERERLIDTGQWPGTPSTLEELLAPD